MGARSRSPEVFASDRPCARSSTSRVGHKHRRSGHTTTTRRPPAPCGSTTRSFAGESPPRRLRRAGHASWRSVWWGGRFSFPGFFCRVSKETGPRWKRIGKLRDLTVGNTYRDKRARAHSHPRSHWHQSVRLRARPPSGFRSARSQFRTDHAWNCFQNSILATTDRPVSIDSSAAVLTAVVLAPCTASTRGSLSFTMQSSRCFMYRTVCPPCPA